MIWLTWRQHRTQALFGLAALAVLAAVLFPTGRGMHRAFADVGLAGCLRGLGSAEFVATEASIACTRGAEKLYTAYGGLMFPSVLLLIPPLLIGLFWGAPLVARELEAGTHRLVWTQGVTRLRWTLVKVGLVLAGTVVVAAGYAWLTTWWLTPLTQADAFNGRFSFPFFDMYGLAPVGYALFAVALGVVAGTVTRRVMPAMAITLVGFVVVRGVVTALARPRYQAPLHRRFPVATASAPNRALGDWIQSDGIYDGAGRLIARDTIGICHLEEADACGGFDRFNVWVYQPGSRFWPFQYIETGVYVGLAALLLAVAVYRIRRRIS